MTGVFSWKGGHHLPLAHHYLWAGSVRYARRAFGRVVLVTDKPGRALLCDAMNLPFDEILPLPDLPDELAHVYELPKLCAYAAMAARGEPFLHVDFDAFLRAGLPSGFAKAPFIAEYTYQPARFVAGLHAILPVKRLQQPVLGAAGGIMGGCALDELGIYAQAGLRVALDPANREMLRNANGYQASVYLGEVPFGTEFGPRIACILPRGPVREDYWRAGYIHFAGRLKHEHQSATRAELQVLADFGPDLWLSVRKRFDALWCPEV